MASTTKGGRNDANSFATWRQEKEKTSAGTSGNTGTNSQRKSSSLGAFVGQAVGNALNKVAEKAVGQLTQKTTVGQGWTPGLTLADPSTDYWSQKYGEKEAERGRRLGIIPTLESSFNNPFYQPYIEQYGFDEVKRARKNGILVSPEEQEEVSSWMQRFNAYDSQMRGVASFLSNDQWSSAQDEKGYQSMVDGYLAELATGISGMKDDSLMKDSAMEYYKYWQQVKQGLKDKQDFFSQFKDENEYTGYKWANDSATAARAAGMNNDEWYLSVQKQAEDAEANVKRIQDQIRYLGDASQVYENGIYMGTDHTKDGQIQQLQTELQQAQREASKAREIQKYASAWRYTDLTERADYSAMVSQGGRMRDQFRAQADQAYKEMLDQYAEYGISKEGSTDIRGDYYATNKDYLLPTDEWTQEQKDIHAYLFATDRSKADEYAQQVNDALNAQSYVQKQQKLEDFASKNVFTGALSTVAAVATMPMSFFDYMDNVVEFRERGTTTQRRDMTVADYGNVMSGAVAEKLNEKGKIHTGIFGDVGLGDAYQLGTSIVESVLYGHLLGAAGTAATFFGSAAKSGFEDAKARGVSDGRAIAYGFASGLAEAGCEYVSLDKLLTMKTPKGLAGYLKNTLIQAGIEGSEEGLTTICNTVADAWINGDKSEIQLKIQEYMEQGMSHSKAEKQAMKEWMQGIASDVAGGAISGGVSTGGEMAVRSTTHTSTDTTRQLVEQGLRTAEGSEARQKAERYAEAFGYNEEAQEGEGSPQAQEREEEAPKGFWANVKEDIRQAREERSHTLSNMEADQLAQAIEEQDRKLIADAAQSRLEALGVTENTPALAEAIAAYASGETPTMAQRFAVSHSQEAQRVISEMDAENMRSEISATLSGEEATPYQRSNDWAKNIGTARVNADVYNGDVAESFRDLLRTSQARGAAEKSGAVQAEGQTQELQGLVWHEGELRVKTRDSSGEVRYLVPDAVQIADPGTADFIQELTSRPDQYKNAPAMYEAYRPGQDIGEYINAWNMAENVYGYTSSASMERAAQDPVIKGVLSDVQLRTAFDLGRSRKEQRQAERSAQGTQTVETQGQAKEQGSSVQLRQGSVSFEGGTINGVTYAAVDQSKLTGRRRAQVEAITMFAEATGIDVVFYQSRKGKDGKYQGANGVYHDGKIWLDVNAGLYGENAGRVAIVRTAGHELTHYIQENAPELYEDLKTFLVDHLLEWKGKSLSELVNEKLARDTTGELDFDGALDEVVADGCEMMLKRSSVVSTLARENPSLFDRIHDWLKDWAAKIRKAFSGVEAYHEEAKAMLDYMDQLQKIWDKALTEATRNAADVRTETKTAADNGGRVQYNLRSIEIDRVYIAYGDVSAEDQAVRDTVNSLIARDKYVNISARDAAEFNGINYNDYKEARKAFRKILRRFLGETITLSHNGQTAKVYLTSRGLDHAAVTDYSPGKAAVYKKMRQLVMNAEYSFSSLDDPHSANAPTGHTDWDTFVSVARFGKFIFPTVIKVRTVDRDLRSQIYNIASKREIGSSRGTGLKNQGGSPSYGGTPISSGNITQKGQKSNHKKSDRDIVRTEHFNKWFGNSTVVNEDGSPKVVYHQTGHDFTVFNTDNPVAGANDSETPNGIFFKENDHDIGLDGKKQMSVYLSVQNPLHFANRKEANAWYQKHIPGYKELQDEMNSKIRPIDKQMDQIEIDMFQDGVTDEQYDAFDAQWNDLHNQMKELEDDYRGRLRKLLDDYFLNNDSGYDGIELDYDGHRYVNGKREDVHTWIVFKNTQVKSATDNIGTYDRSNPDIRYQERDFVPDDRQLLMEAASKRGSSAELKAYSRKVKQLDTLQHKLERQQAILAEAEEQDKAATRKFINKTEQQIERAENALAKMEASPALKAEARSAMAAWREANPNQAAETLRRLREVNRALEKDLAYWKGQAKRTEPGENSVRPEDVRRMARQLIRDYSSEAELQEVTDRLQELGNYIVSGGDINYEDVRHMAREIASLIVDTAYTQEDDNADLRKRVKDYLRSTRLQISDELRGDKTDLDYYRKHNMGTLRLANEGLDIDVAYQEMQEMFGEGLFPRDVTAHSDMLDQMLEAVESLEPVYVPVFQRTERNEATVLLANQIIDRMISDEIRQAYTDTDRAYQAMGQRMQAAEQRAEEAEKRADDIQRTAAIDRRVALQELRKDIAQRQEKRQKRINIDKTAKRLGKWLTENSSKNHIPEKMKKAIGEFLLSIDLAPGGNSKEARKYERRMRDIQAVVTGQQKFLNGQTDNWSGMYLDLPAFLDETIQEHLESLEASNDGEVYDVKSMGLEQLEQLEEILTAVSRAVTTANELMSGEQSAKVSEVGEKTIDHLDKLGHAKRDSAVDRFLQFQNTTPYYFFKRFGDGGMQIFRELQEGWSKLAFNAREIIEYAEDAYTSEEARRLEKDTFTVKLHKRLLTGQEGDDLRSKNKETVTMTRAQAMEIYALSRREQALGHLLGAGIRLGDIDQGRLRKKIQQADNYLLDLEDIAEITGKLSKREKEIVETLQKHMNTRGTEWGNEVSMARFGIRQFTEENYWPISTDSRTRPVRDPGQDSTNLFRLLNMSFTKNTIRDANNAIVIGSAFDTYSNHMADMAKYNALGLALLDTMKWMSYSTATDSNEAGQFTTTSVQKSAERAFGPEAQKYFVTFMKDMNGTHEAGRGEEFASRMMSNYKVAAVAANLRVAFLQPTAYVRAVAVLDAKYLRKGLTMSNKQGREEAEKYSGTAVWKSLGFYDTNINAGLREMIKHTDGAKEKIQEISMKGAEWGDKLTWGTLWNACKTQVQETKHLTGEALMKATAEKFDEVVYRTQVMDSTMTRSHNMRQKGVWAGMTTAFMSEPTLSYNMVLDAYNQYMDEIRKSGSKSAAWQKVKGYVGKSFVAYVSTALAASIVESLVDAARDDDEFQSYAEKWLEAQFGGGRLLEGNLFADLLIHNKLPILKDLDSMLQGYSNNRLDQEWMMSLIKAGRIWKETLALATGAQDKPTTATYNGNMTAWGKIYATLKAASQLTGLPGANLGREIVTAWNNTVGQFSERKISTYDPGKVKSIQYALQDGWLTEDEAVELLLKTDFDGDEDDARQRVYEWGLGEVGKYDAVLAAVKAGDQSAYESAMQTLTDYGYSEKTIRSEIASAIKGWYQTERSVEKKDAIELLQKYGGKNPREAEDTVQKWTALVTAGVDYDQIDEQLLDGQITAKRAVELYQRYGGMTEKDAAAKVQQIQCEIDTGISYGDIKDEFLYGELSEQEAVEMRVKYGGADREDTEKTVHKWSCERDTGIRYEDIDEEYISGNLTAYDAMRLMQEYGGLSSEYAEGNIILYDFRGDDEQLADAYVTTARKYYEYAEAAGLDKVQYYQAYRAASSIESDKDENGNTVKYSLMNKRMAYIDSLNLTPAQKDALFLCFYQSKSLKYAPWRK